MTFYTDRVKILTAALPQGVAAAVAAANDSPLECVVPGLLLHKDRFEGEASKAYLGAGASAPVSRGIFVEVLGSKEIRTTVAVKEVQKTGTSEDQAMRVCDVM